MKYIIAYWYRDMLDKAQRVRNFYSKIMFDYTFFKCEEGFLVGKNSVVDDTHVPMSCSMLLFLDH